MCLERESKYNAENDIVSIIVPLYNSATSIEKCITSLLKQTYPFVEIILINDGSTDNSGELCDRFAIENKNIKVIHKKNGGVSNARNVGIEAAKGEWITFVDSDDFVDPDYVSDMMNHSDCDFVASHIKVEGWTGWKDIPLQDCKWEKHKLSCFFSENLHRLNFMVCKLFRRRIVVEFSVKFDDMISYGEDTLFVYTYLRYVNSAATISKASYHYNCYSSVSLSKRTHTWEEMDYTINQMCIAIEALNERFHCCCIYAQNVIVNNYLSTYIQSMAKELSLRKIRQALKEIRKNKYVLIQIKDKNSWRKSLKRALFDFCMLNRLYMLASFELYLSRFV